MQGKQGEAGESPNAQAIRRAMLLKGLTVDSLAFKVGVSPQTIYRKLNGGSLKNSTLVRIATTLADLPDVVSEDVVDSVLFEKGA